MLGLNFFFFQSKVHFLNYCIRFITLPNDPANSTFFHFDFLKVLFLLLNLKLFIASNWKLLFTLPIVFIFIRYR